jgi:hypothetical protein
VLDPANAGNGSSGSAKVEAVARSRWKSAGREEALS